MNSKQIIIGVSSVVAFLAISLALFIVLDTDGRPTDIEITNLTDTSATIVWDSIDSTISEVVVSEKPLNEFKFQNSNSLVFYDDRDTEESNEFRTNHHVTISNLDPGTRYYFRLNGSFYSFIQETESFKTRNLDIEPSLPEVAYGSVINYAAGEEDPTDGILIYKIENELGTESALQSTYLDSEGDYSLDLKGLYDDSGNQFFFEPALSKLNVNALTDKGFGSTELSLNQTKPLENIVVNIRYISPLDN